MPYRRSGKGLAGHGENRHASRSPQLGDTPHAEIRSHAATVRASRSSACTALPSEGSVRHGGCEAGLVSQDLTHSADDDKSPSRAT
jgi:hypothetical protein